MEEDKNKSLILLDRDGVITIESGEYITRPDDVELIDKSAQAIKLLNDAGILAIIVSNQAGVGKDLMSEEDLKSVQMRIDELLEEDDAELNGSYYCTEKDDSAECRKPNPGLLLQAMQDFGIEEGDAWMVGDSERDIIAGDNAGVGTVLVLTGKTKLGEVKDWEVKPDLIFPDLLWFVRWLLG